MKIAQLAPFEECVPPKKYGGTELVVSNLTEELVKRGHKVYLVASGDSKSKAKILPVFPKPLRTYPEAKDIKIRDSLKFMGIGKVLEILDVLDVDIIHNHIGWRLAPFIPIIKKEVVTTLHGPLDISYQKLVYGKFPKMNYVSISNNQREPFPVLNYAATVYNGIDIKKFSFSEKEGEYLAFLGRMSPEKGPIQAILAAKKSGLKLKMAAKVDIVDKDFFKKKVAPLIDGKQIKFIGEVDHKGKVELLKNAKALLCPIQWREPFGLFFTEAMACGTPVIAFKNGSVPEIIAHKKTGFIVKSIEEMVSAIKQIGTINRKDCRQRVEKYFTVEKMVDDYEKVYYKLLKQKK